MTTVKILARFDDTTIDGEPFAWLGSTRVLVENAPSAMSGEWVCEVVSATRSVFLVRPLHRPTIRDIWSPEAIWTESDDGQRTSLGIDDAIRLDQESARSPARPVARTRRSLFLSSAAEPPATSFPEAPTERFGPNDAAALALAVDQELQLTKKIEALSRGLAVIQGEIGQHRGSLERIEGLLQRAIEPRAPSRGSAAPTSAQAPAREHPVIVDTSQIFYLRSTPGIQELRRKSADLNYELRNAQAKPVIPAIYQLWKESYERTEKELRDTIQDRRWAPVDDLRTLDAILVQKGFAPTYVVDESTNGFAQAYFGEEWQAWVSEQQERRRVRIGARGIDRQGGKVAQTADALVLEAAHTMDRPVVTGSERYRDYKEYGSHISRPGMLIRVQDVAGTLLPQVMIPSKRTKGAPGNGEARIQWEALPEAAALDALLDRSGEGATRSVHEQVRDALIACGATSGAIPISTLAAQTNRLSLDWKASGHQRFADFLRATGFKLDADPKHTWLVSLDGS